MSRTVRARYEKGVLRLLDPVDLREGEEIQVVIKPRRGIVEKYYGIAKKRRPGLSKEDLERVLEEIEDEDIRGL